MRVEMFTFLLAGAICLGGALGVVLLKNPVHNALSLVATLFGVAVLFVNQGAYFLAAIQVIVYAGAIVILFLFVIMLLGVDRETDEGREPLVAQRPLAVATGLAILGLSLVALLSAGQRATGDKADLAPLNQPGPDINHLAEVLFTRYVYAFEITAVLLTVAVVGAVVLSKRTNEPLIDLDEFPEGTVVDVRRRADDAKAQDEVDADAEVVAVPDTEGDPQEGGDD
jgi:NADH-quinone oxidoreductase subunit J